MNPKGLPPKWAARSRSRREWLRAGLLGGVGACVPTTALALGKSSEVGAGQIRSPSEKNHRKAAIARLFWDAQKRTSVNFASGPETVDLARGDEFYRQPFLSWSGTAAFDPLSDIARQRLQRHLRFGGMLWVDAPEADSPFLASVLREIDAILPTAPLKPVAQDHVLFKSFFLLKRSAGRTTATGDGGKTGVLGATISGRLAVIVTVCDALGAFERDQFGTWEFSCQPGGEGQREQAFRFGANVLMYATCLDYKADQVHIPFILKKRRR